MKTLQLYTVTCRGGGAVQTQKQGHVPCVININMTLPKKKNLQCYLQLPNVMTQSSDDLEVL